MSCQKCGGAKVYFDEKKQVERVCTECKSISLDEDRDFAAVAICIATTQAAGHPSLRFVEAIASS